MPTGQDSAAVQLHSTSTSVIVATNVLFFFFERLRVALPSSPISQLLGACSTQEKQPMQSSLK